MPRKHIGNTKEIHRKHSENTKETPIAHTGQALKKQIKKSKIVATEKKQDRCQERQESCYRKKVRLLLKRARKWLSTEFEPVYVKPAGVVVRALVGRRGLND
jgi:hypothetical protein